MRRFWQKRRPMGFNCGIVGLPNVGKSTIFNALTNAGAQAANYPFCTIDPNTGVVPVPDPRLQRLATLLRSEKCIPTSLEFVDIAGLVKGASQGEGLGNQFLSHIRAVDAIAQVVRCFDDADVVHVHGKVDPTDDASVINAELLIADLEQAGRRLERVQKNTRIGQKEALAEHAALEKIVAALNAGTAARHAALSPEERAILQPLQLLSAKPLFYVANMNETEVADAARHERFQALQAMAAREGTQVIPICGKIEAEIAELEGEDRASFLADLGLEVSGLERLAGAGYTLLQLITFFTAGPKETRAWTITQGTTAPQAAGKIHSDLERGFIRAEVYHCDQLFAAGSEVAVRSQGQLRQEGKDYVVHDGDVMFIKFNV